MSDTLTKLSNKYKCDKSDKNHNYTKIYNKYFEKDRNKKFNFMEFGFGKGSSVKMWMEYFTNANIVNIDIREQLPNDKLIQKYYKEDRFNFFSFDQIDIKNILKVFDKYGKFYIIIDDASHVAEDQQYTFGCLFEYITSGGYYIIEDLKCKRNHSIRFDTQSDKTLKVLNEFISTGIFNSKVLNKPQKLYLKKNIQNIEIYNKIAFIQKKG